MQKTEKSTLKQYLDDTEEALSAELNDIIHEVTTREFNLDEIHDRVTEIYAQIRLIKKIRVFMKESHSYRR